MARAERKGRGTLMRLVRFVLGIAILGSAAAAQATTVVIYVEPMTLDRYVRIIDTKGPDRVLMCMAPPATSGCTDVTSKVHRATS
jgi:hypothetical protein